MRKALVVGGANGIGLSIAVSLASREDYETVYIVDRALPADDVMHPKFICHQFDLLSEDYSLFDKFKDVDTLMITAGFGRLALFKDLDENYIISSMNVNSTAVMRIIHRFYDSWRLPRISTVELWSAFQASCLLLSSRFMAPARLR